MDRKSWTELTKRFLPCLCAAIAILICIFALPTQADAASESDLTFALNSDGNSYRVSDCKTSASGELIIPEIYNGKPVTSIGEYAFRDCTSLTSITIPDSVTSINYGAFWGCTSLTSVTIPDSVTSIGNSAFWGCSIKKLIVGDGSKTVASKMIICKSTLSEVVVPDSVTTIGDDAFSGCTSLTSITIPDSVTTIGYRAFSYCTSLESITIPDSATTIDDYAFYECASLESVTIGNSVQSIGYYAFWGCTSLESITIPDSVTSIGGYAFCNCTSLTSITIPDSVTGINHYTFRDCTGLTSITIPDSVTSINYGAFWGCTSLTSITIPDSVTSIGVNAFRDCTSLTSVTIPDSVTSIGNSAFLDCTSLRDVYITNPSAWCKIAFENGYANPMYYGDNLHILDEEGKEVTEVTLDSTVTTIPGKAFRNCTSLTSITIPDSVTSIGDDAFRGCTSLESITIPDSVTSIGNYAFWGCTSLESITIGDSVTSIGGSAFEGCTSLTSITIPDSVTSIGGGAFEGCTSLTSITIPDGVTSIGRSTFNGCTSLTSITIPDSVTSIGQYAFYGFSSLKNVYYTGSQDRWNAISISGDNYALSYATIHYMHVHDYSVVAPVVVAPNCIEAGYTEYTCVFGEKYRTEYIPALGHTPGSNAVEIAPTCTEDGYIQCNCGRCGVQCNIKNSDALGHDYTGPVKVGLAPACETDGWEGTSCTHCDAISKDTVLPATGHNVVLTSDTAASCTKPGSTGGTHCSACNKVFVSPTMTAPALGHDMGQWETTQAPTCTATGTQRRDCSRCDYFETDMLAVINHSYTTKATAPTCTAQGYTTYTCACGDTYTDNYTTALGHNMGNWYTTQEATCTKPGTQRRDCSRCDHFETDEIAKTAHTYTPTVTDPTCTQQGYTTHTCTCGDSYTDSYVPALGLSAPKVTITVDAASCKPALSWANAGEGVTYEIHRATKKTGTYTKVATVATPNWSDASASVGKTYYYKVKAVYAADTSFNSDFSAVVSATTKCATPVIAVSNNSSGKPVVSWSKVSGAKQYTVYVATSQNGSYKKLGTTKSTTYTDAKAKAGTTYFYKVIANASSSKYNSGYSNTVSCGVICGTPSLTVKIDANSGKPSLSWKKVDGATKYAIYRDGELLTTTTALTYADTGAAIDTQYTYTVQALGKTEDLNGNPSKAVTATSGIAKPAAKGSIDAVSGKPVLSWAAVEGAVKYEVYRSTKSNKSYSLVATVEELTYTDTSVSAGKTYYYQVKVVGEVSKSANSSYVKLTGKCATPAITVESNAKAQPVISWEKVSGAKKYTVYRSTSETSGYKSIGTSKTTSYTDTKAIPGSVYYYKVIANASSSKYNSGYSNIVSCGVNCATPVVKVSNNANGKTVLTWSKVTGATKYEIYLLGAEDYVTLATVTGTTWTDADGVVGDGRYYGIRAIASAAEFSSEVSEAVFGKAIPATPKVSGKVGANKKPVLTWGEVEGATKYIVYRSTKKDKGYTVIGESEVLTYEDLTAAKGKTYYYKVVAVGDGVQSAQSSYAKVKSK